MQGMEEMEKCVGWRLRLDWLIFVAMDAGTCVKSCIWFVEMITKTSGSTKSCVQSCKTLNSPPSSCAFQIHFRFKPDS
jgi:hypothetical protein